MNTVAYCANSTPESAYHLIGHEFAHHWLYEINIVDQNGISPSDAVINLNLREQTAQVLKTLTPRE